MCSLYNLSPFRLCDISLEMPQPVQKFVKEYPELLPIGTAALGVVAYEQTCSHQQVKVGDIFTSCFIKSIQLVSENWQIGSDPEERDDLGDKPHWAQQAAAVSVVAAWTLMVSSRGWSTIAISGANFTATLVSGWMRTLEDLSFEGVDENQMDKIRIAAEASIIIGLISSGFAADVMLGSSLQFGQIATGIALNVLERRFRRFLEPIRPWRLKKNLSDSHNALSTGLKNGKSKQKEKRIPHSQTRLGLSLAATSAGAFLSKAFQGNLILTHTLISLLATAVKQWQKNNRLRRQLDSAAKQSQEAILEDVVIHPRIDESIDEPAPGKLNSTAELGHEFELEEIVIHPRGGPEFDNKQEFVPPPMSHQVGFMATTLGAAYVSTFANIPIVSATLNKLGSRAVHHGSGYTSNPFGYRCAFVTAMAAAGGIIKFINQDVPGTIKHIADISLASASSVAEITVRDWQLGKGINPKPAYTLV